MSAKVVPSGRTVTVLWDDMPWTLEANKIREQTFAVKIPPGPYARIWSFLGLDQSNCGEFAIDVSEVEGTRIYQRSMHKEILASYEAWDARDIYMPNSGVTKLVIHLLGHLTGPAGTNGRVHFELIFEEAS